MLNPRRILINIRQKNIEKPIFTHLNIHSIRDKLNLLVHVIDKTIDVLMISEKIDS